jgi:carboxypeptidase PM20D1
VFRLKGSNPALEPILFLSHMDVVPPGDAILKIMKKIFSDRMINR